LEANYYKEQWDYCPVVLNKTRIIIFISEAWYEDTEDIYCELIDENDNVLNTIDGVKAELSDGYYYVRFDFTDVDAENAIAKFSIKKNGIEKAYSLWYSINPDDNSTIKTIEYNHGENDFEMVFDATNYTIDLVCGYRPEDQRIEEEAEDFIEQNMVNETVYGDQYLVTPITFDNIPAYQAVKVARIFKCDTTIVDGIGVKRISGSKLEKAEGTYSGLGNYKIDVQQNDNYIQ